MPNRVNLDYKHQNLTDETIVDFIETTVKPDVASCDCIVCLDFSFNRLSTNGLRVIAKLVEGEKRIKEACVGYNSFCFSEFYNAMAEMNLSKMVEDQRVFMSSSAFDLKLAKMFEAIQEIRRQDVETVDQELRNSASSVKAFAEATKVFQKSVSDVIGWQKGQNDRFDVQMTSAVRSLLGTDDVIELTRSFNKVPKMEPSLPRGFEWDGVLFSNPDTIWLVEAKSAVDTGDIKDMPERMARTSDFLQLIYNETLPSPDDRLSLKQLCNAWKVFNQMPKKIVGVVAALGFTTEQLSAAAERGIKCVYLRDDAFSMV
ncbi:hypothetical protein VOLCADRAFT_104830 [Volvox carteri f. nagariensis]|uniref:Uncharacterized protein n=1 Tax=Volvox carteri f. nagariensis TaxID=3068 RepID=D8TWC1_VOLCA|nr:uncharacterized protein VOLCADRAFT_104830 [Volvox carteri f. nagariensis]EFJ48130.1 hypothetical protein VOLCADRAFT_104830 [Volvox carteri f. nagariensis]|eukprot:XP_002950815.1 hypothetical protein VOLCADRAFT_104830 [Volvox carteri f. nagariensis]